MTFSSGIKAGLQAVLIAVCSKAALLIWTSFAAFYWDFEVNWNSWDGRSYLRIAEFFYAPNGREPDLHRFVCHFPPLYPAVVRFVWTLTPLPLEHSAVILSLLLGLAASFLLAQLMLAEFKSRRAALLAVFFFNLYPTSYFTMAGYSESLFLVLTMGAFLLLRREHRPVAANLLTGAAVLTRLQSVVLMPVVLAAMLKKGKRDLRMSHLLSFFFPAAAVGIYLCINRYYYGNWFFFLEHYGAEAYTQKHLSLPFSETFDSLLQAGRALMRGDWAFLEWNSHFMVTLGWGALFTVLAAALLVFGAFRGLALEYLVYGVCTLFFYASFTWGISNARYSFSVFPIFMAMGLLRSKTAIAIWTAAFLPLLLMFSQRFAAGYWAF